MGKSVKKLMTLLQLKYVSMVAKYGSFSKAAQKLYVSQPGISKMVCALEEELGITIFVRSCSGITLTAEGRELLDMGERLLRDADRISQHFSEDVTHNHELLSVSSQHYCFVIDAMMQFQQDAAKEAYTYKLLVGQNPDVIRQVTTKVSELGVLFVTEQNQRHLNRVFEENGLEFHELVTSRPYVFFHESHPLAEKDVVEIEDLEPYPCIMYELNSDAPSILQEELLLPDFYPKKVDVVSGLYQSWQVMEKCQGYDLGTGVITRSNRQAGVVSRPVKELDFPVSIGWICQKDHILSPPAAKFINYLRTFSQPVN